MDTDAHYVTGSTDILTSLNNYAERRPGFANAVEGTPTVFNNLQRLFTWDRFDGTFYVMACDVNSSGFAQVYKLQSGTDASFVSIFTDTSPTPFDFVVSNNTLYFSNGHVAKKWDPLNGVSNWGIAIGSINSSVSAYCGTGTDAGGGGGNVWVNPANIQGAPDGSYTTSTVTLASAGFGSTTLLQATNYGFALAATDTVVGLTLTLTGFADVTTMQAYLLYKGSTIGSLKSPVPPASSGTFTVGGTSDTWGTTLTPTIVNDSTFGIQIQGQFTKLSGVFPASATFHLDAAQITISKTGGPVVTVSGSAGSMTATAGYQYVFCYGNSTTGHISSPTPVSASTGVFTSKASVGVAVTASTDAQVNQIRVFRTTDGGGGIYYELPNSPFANTTTSVTDAAADANLNINSLSPTSGFNDPPPAFQGMVYFSGRIWGFTGNKVWFSGLEEINQGVPEESFPSGAQGNFWAFDEPVQGLGVAGIGQDQTLAIFCGGRLYGIQGNTLDTFRRFLVSNRRGCRNRAAISMLGGMCAWLDSAGQVWASDGSTLQELSQDIRPDISGVTQANCSLTFHTQGRFHWLVLSTGTKLYVYDIDLEQWMPPWVFSAQYVFSGETSTGNYELLAATTTKALKMSTTNYNDNGSTYAPVIKTNLMSVVPDFGKRFSTVAMGIYNEPTRTGVPWYFQITNNGQVLSDVLICNDEDPAVATYVTIAAGLQSTETTYNRTNGSTLKQLIYPVSAGPAARWIGLKIVMAPKDQADNIYEIFMAYKGLGGR